MNNPELYAKNNQPQRDMITKVVKNYLHKFQWRSDHQDTIIDVGSGTGDMFMDVVRPLLARDFGRIVLTDLKPKMMEFAKSHYQHVNSAEFKVLDIGTELEMPNDLRGQFDHVVSFHCIHLVGNQMQAFKNVYHLLRPDDGGDCLLLLFASSVYFDAYLKLSTTTKWSKYMGEVMHYTCYWHFSKNPEQEAREMLEHIGFTDIDMMLVPTFYDFESVEKFKQVALGISPFVEKMPQELHEEFANDFVEAIIAIDNSCGVSNAADGRFHFTYKQFSIFARRPPAKSIK